jgi:hypothetical protein
MRPLIYFFIVLATLFSAPSFAAMVWYNGVGSTQYSGPGPACVARHRMDSNSTATYQEGTSTIERISNAQYYCGSGVYIRNEGGAVNNTLPPQNWVMIGEGSCNVGTTFDPSTGACLEPPPPCSDKAGQSFPFTKNGNVSDPAPYLVPYAGGAAPLQQLCYGGCFVSTTEQKCLMTTLGQYTCSGTAYYLPQSCVASDVLDIDPNSQRDEPATTSIDEPCTYTTAPDGSQVCTSEKSISKEGQTCGTVNGVQTCVDRKPNSEGVSVSTKVDSTTNPDGSKITKKTDTATHTKCTGINSCSSTTTKTETTTNSDSTGKVTSTSGTCTGPACPDKNTNPDGDGDGYGDCTGTDCDPNGGGGDAGLPEFEETPGYAEATTTFINRVGNSPLVSAIDGIGLNGSGSCSMTSTQTSIGTISAASFCDNASWLDPLYFIFLAIHAFAAVRVFLSA